MIMPSDLRPVAPGCPDDVATCAPSDPAASAVAPRARNIFRITASLSERDGLMGVEGLPAAGLLHEHHGEAKPHWRRRPTRLVRVRAFAHGRPERHVRREQPDAP